MKNSESLALWDLQWNAQLATRYHMYRQNYYARVSAILTASILILMFTALLSLSSGDTEMAGFRLCLALLLQIVENAISPKSSKTLHSTLRKCYLQLTIGLTELSALSKEDEQKFKRFLTNIEMNEPPIIAALIDKSHNELCRVHGLPDQKVNLTWVQRLQAWWFS
ncbi:hypothetical protein [Vibrio scophthalmi]|uniref:SMODS and SLOG-associating 2TM effector domain-containing protein n=1 Tax=Vibrio scophthalmi LMG 19158 TaxID=870967 RepID=F9RLQ9_9VIBR|nr:hypothetical protein [Vibrio scophthalmi]EGU38817.1 hypothetical protein VIS19158_04856 [Vibrio scophthalmi LMG 19158]